MSATIEDVAKALGVSVRGVRLRLDALDSVIDPHMRQGQNNRLLFNGEAFAILRRMEDVRQGESLSIRQAASRIRSELDENSSEPLGQAKSNDTANEGLARELIGELRARITDLESERDHWRELALDYKRALPKPRRGLLTLFRRRGD